jgi:DNA-binding Xre family transcriptional regulator
MRTTVRMILIKYFSFCFMEKINEKICLYIIKNWMKAMSNRAFAIANNIDEKTARRIKEIKKKDYSISIETLKKICAAQGVKLSDFFEKIGE